MVLTAALKDWLRESGCILPSRVAAFTGGAPAAFAEHAESYLRAIFGFMGITNPDVVVAEGLAIGPDHRQAAITAAEAHIAALV
jgi:FMN-dependent NADH-azoreductase